VLSVISREQCGASHIMVALRVVECIPMALAPHLVRGRARVRQRSAFSFNSPSGGLFQQQVGSDFRAMESTRVDKRRATASCAGFSQQSGRSLVSSRKSSSSSRSPARAHVQSREPNACESIPSFSQAPFWISLPPDVVINSGAADLARHNSARQATCSGVAGAWTVVLGPGCKQTTWINPFPPGRRET
jgi:hypothetical protein